MSTGRFVISEIEHDLDGNVSSIAASFEQHCEGGPTALYGEVRYLASAGYRLLGTTASVEPRVGGGRIRNAYPDGPPDVERHGRRLALGPGYHRHERRGLQHRVRDMPGRRPCASDLM